MSRSAPIKPVLAEGPKRDPHELEGELVRVVARFNEFLKFCYIQDPVKGAVRWQPWPYLMEVALDFVREKYLCYLKARQLGISWLVRTRALTPLRASSSLRSFSFLASSPKSSAKAIQLIPRMTTNAIMNSFFIRPSCILIIIRLRRFSPTDYRRVSTFSLWKGWFDEHIEQSPR